MTGYTDQRLEVPFQVAILAGPPEKVCPVYGNWHTVTASSNTYTALTGYASPDDDLTQVWRKQIVDNEQARLVNIEYCITNDSNGDPKHFRGFKASYELPDSTTETILIGETSTSCDSNPVITASTATGVP